MAEGIKLLGKESANSLVSILLKSYNSHYYLNFKTPIDLVVAAILSAQTKDEVVNALTPKLFAKYRTAKDYAMAEPSELTKYIGRVSFAGNKASNIIKACEQMVNKYNGRVPDRMDQLVELPGIGRKTANTILINAYGKVEGIPVDTWVIKLSPRLGLSANTNPDKIEKDLMAILEKKYWGRVAYALKAHGKKLCKNVPLCSQCPVNAICPKNGVIKSV